MTHQPPARIFLLLVSILCGLFLMFSQTSAISAQDLSDTRLIALTSDQKNFKKKEALSQSATAYERKRDEYENAIVQCEEGKPSLYCTVDSSINTSLLHIVTATMGAKNEETASVFGPGLVPTFASYIDQIYQQKPAGFGTYLADVLDSSKIVPIANAQGIGFSALNPVLETWKVFRNISYFVFVIIIIAIGFMVMFRKKISGQTVVTVQQAIPHIIIAMLFVSFSYAIGGLFIDAMYVVLFFISGVFGTNAEMLNSNIFQLGLNYMVKGFDETNKVISDIIKQVDLISVFSGFAGLTAGAIVGISLIFGTIKLFFELLKSYVTIILLIVFAPFILMIGAIPGKNSFSSWVSNLLGNLAAFPVVLLILAISDKIHSTNITTGGFAPPFLLGPDAGTGNALAGLVGIGMLLATTDIIKKVKSLMGAKEGIMGELSKSAWGQIKEGMPISSRGIGGVAGGALGGLGGSLYGGISAVRNGSLLHPKSSDIPEYLGKGLKMGMKFGGGGGARLSRMMGGNQPDYANWVVNLQDKLHGVDPSEELLMQRYERYRRRVGRGDIQFISQQGKLGPPTKPIVPNSKSSNK